MYIYYFVASPRALCRSCTLGGGLRVCVVAEGNERRAIPLTFRTNSHTHITQMHFETQSASCLCVCVCVSMISRFARPSIEARLRTAHWNVCIFFRGRQENVSVCVLCGRVRFYCTRFVRTASRSSLCRIYMISTQPLQQSRSAAKHIKGRWTAIGSRCELAHSTTHHSLAHT